MIIKILATIILSIIAGIAYHMGGKGKPYNTKVRDLGCPVLAIGLLLILYPHYDWGMWIVYILCFGLFFASLTTYWKKKGTDAYWYNWLFTGLGYSFAFLPFAIVSNKYLGFCIRAVIVSLGTMFWSEKIGNVVWEETGRGILSVVSLPLLLI